MNATVKFPQTEVDRFHRVLGRIQRATGVDSRRMVVNGTATFLRSAATITPKSKKFAEVIPNYEALSFGRNMRKLGMLPFFAVRYKGATGARVLVPTASARGEEAQIKTSGAGKGAWMASLRRIRKGGGIGGEAGRVGAAYSKTDVKMDDTNPRIAVSNSLRYIVKLDKQFGIMQKAFGKAGRAISRELANIRKGWVRRWQR